MKQLVILAAILGLGDAAYAQCTQFQTDQAGVVGSLKDTIEGSITPMGANNSLFVPKSLQDNNPGTVSQLNRLVSPMAAPAALPPSCGAPQPPSNLPDLSDTDCKTASERMKNFDNSDTEDLMGLKNHSNAGDLSKLYTESTCRVGNDVQTRTGMASAAKMQSDRNIALGNLAMLQSAQRQLLAKRCQQLCDVEAKRDPTCTTAAAAALPGLSQVMDPQKAARAASECDKLAKEEAAAQAKADPSGTSGSSTSNSSNSSNKGGGAGMAQAMQALSSLLPLLMQQQQLATASATPVPIQDCSNAEYAKTNVLCVCQSDPKNAICQKGEQFPSGIATSNGPQGPSSPLGASTADVSDGAPVGGFVGQAKTASGSATADGGGGGGGVGGGKGLQAIAGGGDGDGGKSGVPTGVIQGMSGGAGGGAGGGTGGYGASSGGGGRGYNGGSSGGGFNIKKLLPTWQNRSIAGMSVSPKDGLTAPLGPSLFEKISHQYQQQKKNMREDR